jgi:hypothetical protein
MRNYLTHVTDEMFLPQTPRGNSKIVAEEGLPGPCALAQPVEAKYRKGEKT